jgi:hypothetical protein
MSRYSLRLRSYLPKMLLLTVTALLGGTGLAQAATGSAGGQPPEAACDQGQFCAWPGQLYAGQAQVFDLRTANPGECIPFPADFDGHSFANKMKQLISVYEGRDCSTEGDFTTYPGGGTFVPQAPFVVRAIQIWP